MKVDDKNLETSLNYLIDKIKDDEDAKLHWSVVMYNFSKSLSKNLVLANQLELIRRGQIFKNGGIPNENN